MFLISASSSPAGRQRLKMPENNLKPETRIIPQEVPPKFYAQHLKPYEFIRSRAAGKKVLEVGCGDGYGAAYLAGSASEVVGIDYALSVIARAQEKYALPNLKFLAMEATSLSFDAASFDLACSFQVIEHIPADKLPLYLSQIRRILKIGGQFWLSTLNLDHNLKSARTYEKHLAHCKEFRLQEIRGLLADFFPTVKIYGLHLGLKHRLFLGLKRSGVLNFLPQKYNPVARFYQNITTADFKITSKNLKKAIDFICVCTYEL